jgi:hypothetical protein
MIKMALSASFLLPLNIAFAKTFSCF